MTVALQSNRAPRPSSLADVLDLVLDKGIVIDAYVRVALVGIELLTVDARIVIASVDTYLRFAEAVNRLDLQPHEQATGLPGLIDDLREGGAKSKTKGAVSGAAEGAKQVASSIRGRHDDDNDDDDNGGSRGRRVPAGRSAPRSRRGTRSSRDDDEG
jgi:gas vesicle structural protein